MELKPRKSSAGPPAPLDAAIRLLIPPACREHVLGDLWERYTTPWQYVVDVLRTLPFVIGSQIRRTSDPLRLALWVTSAFAFFGGLGGRPGNDGVPWLRAVAPAIAVAAAMVVREAYRGPTTNSSRRFLLDAGVAAASVLASQAILAIGWPALMLSAREALSGGLGTLVVLYAVRGTAPPGAESHSPETPAGGFRADDFARDVQQFERRIRYRNRREVWAGWAVVLGFGVGLWVGPTGLARVGCALTMAGALFIIYRIRTRAAVRPILLDASRPDTIAAYRREMEKQRDLLRTVTWWYLLPLLPGLAVLTLGQALAVPQPGPGLRMFLFVLLTGLLIRQLNRRGARRLQYKIDRLATLETLGGAEADRR